MFITCRWSLPEQEFCPWWIPDVEYYKETTVEAQFPWQASVGRLEEAILDV